MNIHRLVTFSTVGIYSYLISIVKPLTHLPFKSSSYAIYIPSLKENKPCDNALKKSIAYSKTLVGDSTPSSLKLFNRNFIDLFLSNLSTMTS